MNQVVTQPWRKKYRVLMLKISFLLFWPGFHFAYQGGTQNNPIFISISFLLLGLSALLAMFIQK